MFRFFLSYNFFEICVRSDLKKLIYLMLFRFFMYFLTLESFVANGFYFFFQIA